MVEQYKLKDVSNIIMGQSPKGSSYNDRKIGLPLLNGAADYKGQLFNPKQYTSEPTRIAEKGDIIFGVRATIGNFAITDAEYCIGRGVSAIRVNEDILSKKYLIFVLKRRLQLLKDKAPGSTIKGIKKDDLTEMKISLPPLKTQQYIVEILDNAAALRDNTQKLLEEYDQLSQSIFLDMFGDPMVNEKQWEVNRLGDLTTLITDGKHGNCNDEVNSGYYFISAKDVRDNKINYQNTREIPENEFREVDRRTNLQPGDLVMVNTGATIGRMAIAKNIPETRRTTFQKSVAVIKTKQEILISEFLQYVFELRLESFATKGSGSAIKNLLLSEMRRFQIITPPIELQSQFIEKITSIEKQKELANQELKESEYLFQALLQKAFKGELVEEKLEMNLN